MSASYYSPTLKLDKTWLKVARADQHLDHLRQRISLIEADVFSIAEERDPRNDDRVWRMVPGAKASNLLDVSMYGVIVGDVIHQLRSALDHAVWKLAKPPVDFETAFPICLYELGKKGSFQSVSGKRLRNVDPSAVNYIESVQPYKRFGVKDPLWALNELWNWDKHRQLIVVANPQWTQPLMIAFPDPKLDFAPGEQKEPDSLANEILRLDANSDAQATLAQPAPVRIVFKEPAVVSGKPVLAQLEWIKRCVQSVLVDLEAFL